jgi:hypothetical protein
LIWNWNAAQSDSITPIAANTAITLRLDGQGTTWLAYDAPESQAITVTVQATGESDPVVEILKPDGTRLAYNDDHPYDAIEMREFAPTDAGLIGLTLPIAGRYLIRVNSFNGVSAGEVEVALKVVDLFKAEISDLSDSDGAKITFELPTDGIYSYSFEGTAGQILTLTARDPAGLMDSVITLKDASGAVVASNDDHHSNDFSLNIFDARIADFTVSTDAIYTLEVREFTGRAGLIEITIQH